MASGNQWNDVPRIEPYVKPVNGIVQPPIMPPPNRPGRRTNVLDMLKQVHNALMRRRCAIYFKDPVDSIGLGVPHYHEVIRRPMDLRTIRKRLDNNYYCQAAEAIEDFNLIFENCGTFNLPGTLVHRDGVELKMLFDKHLSQIDLTKEVEVMPKQSQSKLERPSLNPDASVSNQVEVAEKAKPKPNSQPGKSPSGGKGFAPDPPKLPSQSKPELPSLNPAASVSNQVEVAEKAKPKPDSQPGKSPSGLKILDPDSPKTLPNSFCPPPPKLRNYVKVKTKREGRKRPRLMPAASVPYGRKLEMEKKAKPSVSNQVKVAEKAKPKPNSQPDKSPLGHKGLDLDLPKSPSQSKPELPSLNPAASVSNQVEVAEKAKPKPDFQPGKSPSGLKILDPDSPKTLPNSFCPPPKLRNYVRVKTKREERKRPRLMPAASVPYGRKLEMEKKAKPFVSNQVEVAEKAKPKPNSQPSQTPKREERKRPRLMPAASVLYGRKLEIVEKAKPSVSHQVEVAENTKSKPGKSPSGLKILDPDSPKTPPNSFRPPPPKLRNYVRVKTKREERKRPRLMPAASVPYGRKLEMDKKAKPSVSNQVKVAEKAKPKPNSQPGKGLAPDPPKFPSKSFCPPKLLKPTDEMDVRVKAKREKRKRPRLSTAASVPYEMEMDVEEKAKRVKRKKAKKEKRPNLPSQRPVASLPKSSPGPSKSPSGRESLGPNRFCFKKLDRYIERSNFRNLLRTVRNRKFFTITWIFNEARSWKYYSENKAFDYKASKLDWPTLEDHAKSSRFKSFDHSVSILVEKMFENGLRCFAGQSEIRTNIKKTIYLFNQKLDRRRKAVVQEKSLARVLWAYQTWKQKLAARKARESGMPVEAPEFPEKAFHRVLDLQSTEDIESEEDIEFPEDLEPKEGTGAPSGREDLPKPDLSVLECYKMEVVDGVDGQAQPEAKQVS